MVGLLLFIASGLLLLWVWPSNPLPKNVKADKIFISKSDRTLTLFRKGRVLKSYWISLGGNPIGHKIQQGDERTPEGTYRTDYRNAQSRFHRALHISYPNAVDRRKAKKKRVSPGGDIMIHGIKNGWGKIGRLHLLADWTNGCIAVTDEEIREIWRAVPNGTLIEIKQ